MRTVLVAACIAALAGGAWILHARQAHDPAGLAACTVGRGATSRTCLADVTWKRMRERSTGVALRELEAVARTDPRVSTACHSAMHPVGQRAFKRDGSWSPVEAAQRVPGQCANGFIHGYVGAAVERGGPTAIASAAAACTAMFPKHAPDQSLQDCVHGLGHGARRTGSLDTALGACARIGVRKQRFECFGGALMEDAAHADGHGTDTTAAPCDAQVGDRARACYLYLPTRRALAPRDVVRICETAATADTRSICAFSAAARIGAGADPVARCGVFDAPTLAAACMRGYFSNEIVSYHRLSERSAMRSCGAGPAAASCQRQLGSALALAVGSPEATTACRAATTDTAARRACSAGAATSDVLNLLEPSKAT